MAGEKRKINKAQEAAINHNEGPVLVVAGAGTGKTTVITERIARLITEKKAKPSEILALTFTEKAAAEMEERVDELVPYGFVDTKIMTFHAFGDSILREFAFEANLPTDYQVMSGAEQILFLRDNIAKLGLKTLAPRTNPNQNIGPITNFISRLKDENISAEDFEKFVENHNKDEAGHDQLEELKNAYLAYETLLGDKGRVDYGDQILKPLELVTCNVKLKTAIQKRFKYILVDEFQDTNYTQNLLLNAIVGEQQNLMVVGDDDQSIYKFRGAAISNILEFTKNYPKAKRLVLNQNYRSTQAILDATYRLIQNNNPNRLEVTEKIDKRLTASTVGNKPRFEQFQTDLAETGWISDEVLELTNNRGFGFQDIAILVRTHSQARSIAEGLSRAGIPYLLPKVTEIWEEPLVQALVAFAQSLVSQDDDIVLFKLLTSELIGISAHELAPVLSCARRFNKPLRQIIEKGEYPENTSQSLKHRLAAVIKKLNDYADMIPQLNAGQLIWDFIKSTGFLKELEEKEDTTARAKVANLAQFLNQLNSSLTNLSDKSLYKLVEILPVLQSSLDDSESADIDPNLEAVNILTVHSAKGLEWPVVFIPFASHGKFPQAKKAERLSLPEELIKERLPKGDEQTEEERRLFYVAMTRAKQLLYITASEQYSSQKRKSKLSQFVIEALGNEVKLKTPIAIEQTQKLRLFDYANESVLIVPPHLKLTKSLKLSVSQIEQFEICPKKFEYQVVYNLFPPKTSNLVFGTAIHSAIKTFFEVLMAKDQISKIKSQNGNTINSKAEEKMLDAFEKAWTGEGFSSQEEERRQFEHGKNILLNFKSYAQKEKINPVAIEEPFEIMVGNIRVTGRYDAVLADRIIDFKTAVPKDQAGADSRAKKSLQLKIYELAWQKTKQQTIETGLLFVEPLLFGQSPTKPETMEKVEELICEVGEKVSRGEFVAKPDYQNCKMCDYRTVCSFKYPGA